MHREFGLVLQFAYNHGFAATLDGSPGLLVTELIRLAAIGKHAEHMRDAGEDGRVSDLVDRADAAWKRFLK